MHNLFLVYFVNLYMFRAAHQQEVQPYVYNSWYVLFFLDDCLLSWLDWNGTHFQSNQDNRQLSKKNKYQLSYTYGCTS
jgi:hypothetical protein